MQDYRTTKIGEWGGEGLSLVVGSSHCLALSLFWGIDGLRGAIAMLWLTKLVYNMTLTRL